MYRLVFSTLIAFGLAACLSSSADAQQKRVSPHETVSTVIDGNRVTVVYGRPYSKNPKSDEIRKIWGGLVGYGKVWRMGADEATLLITEKDIDFGGKAVPAGAYTLFLLPKDDGSAQLIVSKKLGQWGTQYDESKDLVRIDAKKESTAKSDQFTMGVSKGSSGGGVISAAWEETQYQFPFTVAK